ncbi:MAG: GNAT family N-acetyltransferase [Solirubrobacterales bacterium]
MWDELTKALSGDVISLQPIQSSHEGALFTALDYEVIWRWIPIERPDREAFTGVFNFLLEENEAGRMGTFVNVAQDDGTVIGTSSYLALRPEHRGLEVGWTMLSPSAWGIGANVEAKLLMLDHAFGELKAQRVEFKTDANNERSRGALAALPAQFEGVFRKHMETNYGVRDSAYYSVVDDDWPEVRTNLESRLKERTR